MIYTKNRTIKSFLGRTFTEIAVNDDNTEIRVICNDNKTEFWVYHEQKCCEQVYIEDIVGNLQDLLNSEIIMAEEESNTKYTECGYEPKYSQPIKLWTFYKLATNKGYVTIRWYGTSNGFYSEKVSILMTKRTERNAKICV